MSFKTIKTTEEETIFILNAISEQVQLYEDTVGEEELIDKLRDLIKKIKEQSDLV